MPIMVTDPRDGQSKARKELILDLWQGRPADPATKTEAVPGMSRSQIVGFLNDKCAHRTTFQVVFQATQNIEQGSKAGGLKTEGSTTRAGGFTGKLIPDPREGHEGQQIGQSELIRQLIRGDKDKGIKGLSRNGVIAFFKEKGIDPPAYGTVYGVSKRLAEAENVEITPNEGRAAGGKGGSKDATDADAEGSIDDDELVDDDLDADDDDDDDDEEGDNG